MKNKRLEQMLLYYGGTECIPLIEICENDKNVKEIEVDKAGFTRLEHVDSEIEKYLKKLNIKVKYVNMEERIGELEMDKGENKKPKCHNVVHAPFKRPMSKEKKVTMYKNYKMNMFSLDKDTFVVCPDCKDFVKL